MAPRKHGGGRAREGGFVSIGNGEMESEGGREGEEEARGA